MKHGRIIVEGITDCYFIHQLICERFADSFKAVYDNPPKNCLRYPVEKDEPAEAFRFEMRASADVTLEIRDNGGSSKTDVLKGLLRDESGEDRKFYTCVIFDADFPARDGKDATGNGGLKTARESFVNFVPADSLFLFPTNREDGTLETLLKRMANATNDEYFTQCWPAFADSLSAAQPRPKRSLSAKTELANYVEAYGSKISERKCYLQNLKNEKLWDYTSNALDDLIAFLANFIGKLTLENDAG